MPLYEITAETLRLISQASFANLKVRERGDLQRMLRSQINVLADDLYVLTEEFEDWEDSRRRIDLLAIDQEANLVVIELKRTNDGGHMELQAIRYASMISAMTFDRAEQIHGEFLTRMGEPGEQARTRILTFLDWNEPDEENFASDVRIILVSEDFGKELITAVLWLRERDIDIRCVRLRPYRDRETRLIDVQQIIPLPEAHELSGATSGEGTSGTQEAGGTLRSSPTVLGRTDRDCPQAPDAARQHQTRCLPLARSDFRDSRSRIQLRDSSGIRPGRTLHRSW